MGLNKLVDSTAELLKEKGFDEPTTAWRQRGNGISGDVVGKKDYYNRKGDVYTSLPTISDVVMWLYDKYGVWISVYMVDKNEFHWETDINEEEHGSRDYFKTPTEAYEAAIEYVLNNVTLSNRNIIERIEVKIIEKDGKTKEHIINSHLLNDDELKRLIWEEWESEIKEEDPRQMILKYMKLMRQELIGY